MKFITKSHHYLEDDDYKEAHEDIVISLGAAIEFFEDAEFYFLAQFFGNKVTI